MCGPPECSLTECQGLSLAQAFQRKILVDVSTPAQSVGFLAPVVLSCTLWADIAALPEGYAGPPVKTRLEELLRQAREALQAVERDVYELAFPLTLPQENRSRYSVKMVWGGYLQNRAAVTLLRGHRDLLEQEYTCLWRDWFQTQGSDYALRDALTTDQPRNRLLSGEPPPTR